MRQPRHSTPHVLCYPLQSEAADAAGPAARTAPIKLAIISEGIITWPLYVAQALKLFEREGVTVDVTVTRSSVKQLEEVIAGRYDIGFQQADHVVRAVEQGSDLFIFMANGHAPAVTLVAAPDVKRIADLKGQVIGVDGANTGYALLLWRLLRENGLRKTDYEVREFGGSQERFEALKSGAAGASLLNSPFDRRLQADGYNILGALNTFFPKYPGSIAATRRSWAQRNPEALVGFIRAMTAGYEWLRDPAHKAQALEIFPKRLDIDAKAADAALERFASRPRPQMSAEGLSQVVETVWEGEGRTGVQGRADKYMDLTYLARAGSN
jgi:ABC-type nitrate/sulfonate/bicarbonate transport system substrate-binding protein